jgi:hypothetical protein
MRQRAAREGHWLAIVVAACHDERMRVAAMFLLVGCWGTREVAPVAPAQVTATSATVEGTSISPTIRAARRDAFPRHSVWEGTYVCNQGLSAVTLTLDVDRGGTATARYDFGPVPTNPTVPSGSYSLNGAVNRQDGGGFAGDFEPAEWIVHPANYFMVPLSIESDGKTMTGSIRHSSCNNFQTSRIE